MLTRPSPAQPVEPSTPPPARRRVYARDRTLRWRAPLIWALAGAGAFGATAWLANRPALAERVSLTLGPAIARPLSLFTGAFPFAVAEALLGLYVLSLLFALGSSLSAVAGGQQRLRNALAGGALRVLRDAGFWIFMLYAMWGFNYARPPLEARLGWPRWDGAELAEVVKLAEASVAATNRAYVQLHGSEDAGAPTVLTHSERALQTMLERGWASVTEQLGLPESTAQHYGAVKLPLISPILARLGLSGVYSPYTAEPNAVRGMPAMRLPVAMAHEQAHQRGIAIEAEASFLGMIVGAHSADPLARYAAVSFAQSQLVGALPNRERRRLAAQRLPGVVRDLRDLEEYRRRNDTVAGTVQSAVNDRYLRANRVPGGIQSYGRSAFLLILYVREHPEELEREGMLAAGR
jgi:hypothetical protein